MSIARVFSEPIIIIVSWAILIIGILGAAHLVGAKMPDSGTFSGAGDLLRNA